ncbi:MAG TPA: acyltransferase family protein [Patescibacteria group bacterium]|nr:acyltransferase family protein [Patescibacteria group bacterium]
MTKKITNYELWPDIVRVVAILAVVAIHTFNSVYQRPDFFGGISWWFSILVDSFSRICIPLFIMLSGYFMLKRDERFSRLLKRIFNRLFVPLVFWTILVYALSTPNAIKDILQPSFYLRFFSGNVYYFYFLVILIGLYFIVPLFRNFIKTNETKTLTLMSVSFLTVGVVETAEEYFIRNCAVENSFTKWVPYAGLFLFGYLIGTNKIKFKNFKAANIVYVIGLLLTLVLNFFYFKANAANPSSNEFYQGCLSQYSDYYLSFNVVLMSIPAFYLLSKFNYSFIKNNFVKKIIYQIARCSFGIYLTHLFIVTIWDYELGLTVDNIHIPLWSYVIVKWLVVFIVSFAFTYFIDKIPYVKKLIGSE